MRLFYAFAVVVQLLPAFLFGNRNRISYMLHLWKSLLDDCEIITAKSKTTSESALPSRESKLEAGSDEYSFLLER